MVGICWVTMMMMMIVNLCDCQQGRCSGAKGSAVRVSDGADDPNVARSQLVDIVRNN